MPYWQAPRTQWSAVDVVGVVDVEELHPARPWITYFVVALLRWQR